MKRISKRVSKRNYSTSATPEHSSTSLVANTLNRSFTNLRSFVKTPTATELIVGSSPSAPIIGDMEHPALNKKEESSAPIIGDVEHQALNKKEQSRISRTVTIGQEDTFDKVCTFLTMKEVGIVGIYGMGGVGKTTLMMKVCYELKLSKCKVIWITVSKTVNEENIQKSILRELNLTCYEHEDPQTRAIKINEALYNDKRSLIALLLDDIWEAIRLEELGVAGGLGLDTSMFKIIFTTRSKDVCLQMYPDEMIRMNCLGPEESWVLFNRVVDQKKTLDSHDRILTLAREVTDECGGLPLAITVIGKAMVCKRSVGAWEDALMNLRNRSCLISGTDRNLYERLKFSYDNLENEVERECFLFCCMYPEDETIDIGTLIDCWIGEGLLDITSYDSYRETCNRGHNIVDTLVAKSMLEARNYPFQPCVKIHDVIRDMGLWIGSARNLFLHIDGLKPQGKEIEESWKKGRWVYINYSIHKILYCPELSVLHMEGANTKTELSSPLSSLRFMHKLKVLILRFVEWECHEIPTLTIGLLVELRHLEISYSDLRELPPDIGNLAKLLVMKLMHNDELITLPTSIGDLCELRKLQIRSSSMTDIASEYEKLKKLKKLEIVEINVH